MKHAIAFLCCALLIAAGPAARAPSAPALTIQSAIDARVAYPGTAIAVGRIDRGKVQMYFAGSTGNGRPLDEHCFEIGSVTKTFTATVLAEMVSDIKSSSTIRPRRICPRASAFRRKMACRSPC